MALGRIISNAFTVRVSVDKFLDAHVNTSLIPRLPPFCVLRFAFSIIHGSGRARKTGVTLKVGMRRCNALWCQLSGKDDIYSTIIKQHVLFKLHASIFNRSSQNACCSHSSVDTHTASVENIITVCLHALSRGALYTHE